MPRPEVSTDDGLSGQDRKYTPASRSLFLPSGFAQLLGKFGVVLSDRIREVRLDLRPARLGPEIQVSEGFIKLAAESVLQSPRKQRAHYLFFVFFRSVAGLQLLQVFRCHHPLRDSKVFCLVA